MQIFLSVKSSFYYSITTQIYAYQQVEFPDINDFSVSWIIYLKKN